jgi:hypothetical protein
MHVGLRRAPDEQRPEEDLRDPSTFGMAMFSLLTGGARDTLEERLAAEMTPARIVRQPESTTGGPADVLDVAKLTKEKVREMFVKGAWHARRKLLPLDFHVTTDAKLEIDRELTLLVQRSYMVLGLPDNEACDFRSNVYLPMGSQLHRRFWCNMDPPGGHSFSFSTGQTGLCFAHRVPMACNLEVIRKAAEEDRLGENSFGMTKEDHAKVRADRTWLVSIPIFDPNEFLVPPLADRADIPASSPFHHVLPRVLDGVIYGVMNVDARIDYAKFGISDDPSISSTDRRLSAIIDLARLTAARIGRQLAICFGGKERSHEKA